MNAEFIYKEIEKWFINHNHRFRNKYIFKSDWESDFFCVSDSDYCIEVEVKVSKGDFKADFKKEKHTFFKQVLLNEPYFITKKAETHKYEQEILWDEKIGVVKYGYKPYPCTPIKIYETQTVCAPNKFWYAMPEGLVTVNEIPSYAGLMTISEGGGVLIKKPAPFIHKRKLDIAKLLFDKYVYCKRDLEFRIYQLEDEVVRLKNQIQNQILTPNL